MLCNFLWKLLTIHAFYYVIFIIEWEDVCLPRCNVQNILWIMDVVRALTLQWRHNQHDSVSITSRTIVYSTVYWGADQRKHQSCTSLDFVRGIRRWPVNSPHKKPITQVDITHIFVDYPHWIPTVEHGSYFELIMMTSSNGNIFRVTSPLCGEFTGHRWIPCTKASNAELWFFLWSALE